MVRMEVRKEDAVYGEGIQARTEHAAEGARTEVEDERLTTGAHHDAALASLEAGDYGAGTYYGDLHGPPFGRKLSAFSFQQSALWLRVDRSFALHRLAACCARLSPHGG